MNERVAVATGIASSILCVVGWVLSLPAMNGSRETLGLTKPATFYVLLSAIIIGTIAATRKPIWWVVVGIAALSVCVFVFFNNV